MPRKARDEGLEPCYLREVKITDIHALFYRFDCPEATAQVRLRETIITVEFQDGDVVSGDGQGIESSSPITKALSIARIKLSGFGSTSFVRVSAFVLLWSCGRSEVPAKPSSICPQAMRRADLGGVFRFADQYFRVVAADASRPVKDSVRTVGIDVDPHPSLDEMRAHRAFRNLQFQRPETRSCRCRPGAPPARTKSRRDRRL